MWFADQYVYDDTPPCLPVLTRKSCDQISLQTFKIFIDRQGYIYCYCFHTLNSMFSSSLQANLWISVFPACEIAFILKAIRPFYHGYPKR
jgi:hypothetical protein